MAVQRHGVSHDVYALLQRVQCHAPLKRGAERAQLRRLQLTMSTAKCRAMRDLVAIWVNPFLTVSHLRNEKVYLINFVQTKTL